MDYLLPTLYGALGLNFDEDNPMLFCGDDLAVYFEETATGLEMICPLGPLPDDVKTLQRLLQYNCADSAILAADSEAQVLLALLRTSGDSAAQELCDALDRLVDVATRLKSEFRL